MRTIVSIVLGIILVAAAYFGATTIIANKKKPKPKFEKIVKTVFVDKVQNSEVPIVITSSGNLVAKRKINLFAEVQGVLKLGAKDFKAGTHYRKGARILAINSEEFSANLMAQKSNFHNSVAAVMPDIKLDFPEEFQKWQAYLSSIDIHKSLPTLPKTKSDKEKYFITGKGINTAYYNVKNLEARWAKYHLVAPFNGVLTEALITPGSLVRTGQRLGEFIDPSVYEMEVAISADYADLLQKGKSVTLYNIAKTKNYTATVARINGKIDAGSQTVKAFLEVRHPDLKEGMYLEAQLEAKAETNAIEISRKLLIDNKKLYIVADNVLKLLTVNPVYFTPESVVIKDIPDGTLMLSRNIPGAYEGMQVKIFED